MDMQAPRDLKEHVLEMLLNDEKVHQWITNQAKEDLRARGLSMVKDQGVYDELVCLEQIRILPLLLMQVVLDPHS